MTRAEIDPAVEAFQREVGSVDPVTVVGARTQWDVGGSPDPDSREVSAPSGIYEYEPAEMTLRCGAGTPMSAINARLAEAGQMVPFDAVDDAATVGGLLAVGRSGIRRLRYGHVRDLALQVRYVADDGTLVTAGGPTVKNVSGYDLVRLMVGSLGTLGCLAEVILRCLPAPQASQWCSASADPVEVRDRLYRPSSILWDGERTWVLLEGHSDDVSSELDASGLEPCSGPPELPLGGRESLRPRDLPGLSGEFVAEIGVGVVHRRYRVEPEPPGNLDLQADLKQRFDPLGRLNPGRRIFS